VVPHKAGSEDYDGDNQIDFVEVKIENQYSQLQGIRAEGAAKSLS
jgi:hypothetical protein